MNMEKKEYMTPTCEVVEIEIVSMIATSPSFNPDGEEEENDTGNMSNRHRGQWGNLWGSDK